MNRFLPAAFALVAWLALGAVAHAATPAATPAAATPAAAAPAAAKAAAAVTTATGLVYQSLREGTGPSPKASDTVRVHYRGTFPESGKEFDSSLARGEPIEFPLKGVIPCWTEGVQKMKVGAQWVRAMPGEGAQNAAQMLAGGLKGVLLLNTEPEWDSAAGAQAAAALGKAEMVVTLSPFRANMEFSDVLLPIAPFTETSGSFVNAEGRLQSFHAVVKPRGETRPGWKVLRVLANLLGVAGFDFETSQDVLAQASGAAAGSLAFMPESLLNNAAVSAPSSVLENHSAGSERGPDPVVASIYQLDGIVRRAPALQLTADARRARGEGAAA